MGLTKKIKSVNLTLLSNEFNELYRNQVASNTNKTEFIKIQSYEIKAIKGTLRVQVVVLNIVANASYMYISVNGVQFGDIKTTSSQGNTHFNFDINVKDLTKLDIYLKGTNVSESPTCGINGVYMMGYVSDMIKSVAV